MGDTVNKWLDGKAVIVTGAGQGIGAAIAKGVAELGGKVLVNDIDTGRAEATAKEIRSSGGAAAHHTADIAIWSSGAAIVQACLDAFGALDGLVNNAGVFSTGTFDEMGPDDMLTVFKVNAMGTAACAQAAARYMVGRRNGSIVNVVSGAQMGMRGLGAYGASKGAVASLTYAWAAELTGTGVRINAVSPRAETKMAEMTRIYNKQAFGAGKSPFPTPAMNVPLVCYLLSDLSTKIHGQIVRSDGEVLALMTHPAILSPVLRSQSWSVEEIDRAFLDHLAQKQQAVGIATVDARASN